MHGLMGGDWKRKRPDQGREEEQRNGKPLRSLWLHDLPSPAATAPAPDPPSDVFGVVFSASSARGGDTEAAWRRHENPWGAYGRGQDSPNSGSWEAGRKGRADLSSR